MVYTYVCQTCSCTAVREGLPKEVRKAGSRLQIPADGPACVIHSGDNCGHYLTQVGYPGTQTQVGALV